jgi:Bacterial Ig domain
MVSFLSTRQCMIAALVVLLMLLAGLPSPSNLALAQESEWPTVNLNPAEGSHGIEVTATSSGWLSESEVKVLWNGAEELNRITADSSGGFTVSFRVPENADPEVQNAVYFVGLPANETGESGLEYWMPATFTVTAPAAPPPPDAQPTITLDPTEGAPGTEVTIQGSGWIPGDTVSLWFAVNLEADGSSTENTSWYDIGQAVVGDDGTFISTFTVPVEATDMGEQGVSVDTYEASKQAVAFFHVVTEPEETPSPETEPTFTPQVTALQFYESGYDGLPPDQRVYDQRFASETSRYINWQLDLSYPAPGRRIDFQITAIYLHDSGTGSWEEFHRQTSDEYVEGDWTGSYHGWGNGCDEPEGCWDIGSYRVDIYFEGLGSDGQLIASEQFEIYGTADTEPPPVSWVKPVPNLWFQVASSGTVELEVTASDSSGIRSVEFNWYGHANDQLVAIGADSSAPYQASVDVNMLNIAWNEIFVIAEDTAGNRVKQSIFIYRVMPTITLDPIEGFQSKEVTVQGSGWFPGDTVIISLADPANEVTQVTVDNDEPVPKRI